MGGGAGQGHVRGRRRAKKRPLSEINVTPLVDVMLVLLIIFMISAPLLAPVGVPVELPETDASPVEIQKEPLTVSIDKDGSIFIGTDETSYAQLLDRVGAAAGDEATKKPIFVRADGRAPYQAVARVMARLSSGGFTKLNLITDTAPDTPSRSGG